MIRLRPKHPAELDPAETAESVRRLAAALASQPADVQLAINLFVVEGMSAADVARLVGWPNAKAVYNRVSRALANLRIHLEGEGIGRGDL
jgi:DNA-directed RNA polymerase specialized sigma24 family protein